MPSNPTYGGLIATAPVEAPNSGRIEVGDRTIKTQVKHGKYSDLEAALPYKGQLTGDGWQVLSAVLEKDGGAGVLTTLLVPVAVALPGGGTGLPPDRWSLRSAISDVPVERHVDWGALTEYQKKEWNIAFGLESSQPWTSELAKQWLRDNGDATITNLRKLKESGGTMPVVYWYYTWVSTTFFVPALSDGNVIESPYGPGAPYLGGGLSWKRSPDNIDVPGNGTCTTTREWIGVPTSILTWNSYLFG